MFSQVQIKQEFSGTEDSNQNGQNCAQNNSEYPVFTNQDVEYMYRQLPQFWSQNQGIQLTEEVVTTKNETQQRPNMAQSAPPTISPFLQPTPLFQLSQQQQELTQALAQQSCLSTSPDRQQFLNQLLQQQQQHHQQQQQQQQRLHLAEGSEPPQSSPPKHTGPGRPPKTTNPNQPAGKKPKCQCEICFKEFGHKSNLFIHMRTHNGERPYKCNQCEKCFTHSGNLAIHMRTHSGERPYTCQICGKMFSHSGNLSTHLRTHSGVKPYKCSVCGKEFRHSGNLSIHERIHSGVKPFQCKICGKEFYHSGNLTTHMKKHPINSPIATLGNLTNNKDDSESDDLEQQQQQQNPMRLAVNVASASTNRVVTVTNQQTDSLSVKSEQESTTRSTNAASPFVPSTS